MKCNASGVWQPDNLSCTSKCAKLFCLQHRSNCKLFQNVKGGGGWPYKIYIVQEVLRGSIMKKKHLSTFNLNQKLF